MATDETQAEPAPQDVATTASIKSASPPPAETDEPSWLRWGGWAAAAGATIVAAILGFRRLAEDSFWVDEGSSVMIADQSLGETWRLLMAQELNGSPYFLLLNAWLRFGRSEAFVRSLSTLFAVATVPIVFLIGRKLFGTIAGVAAAVLLAVNAYFIQYAQEARQYSFALFGCSLATLLLIHAVERRRAWLWIAYAIVSAVAVYAHFFNGFVVLAHVVSLVGRRWKDIPWRQALLAYGGMAVALLPVALFVKNNDRGQIDWVPEPTPTLLREGFDHIVGFSGESILWAYGIAGVLALVAMVASFVREGRSLRSWGYVLCILSFIAPIALSYGVSFVKPIFFPRYIIISVGFLALTAAGGLSFLRPKPLALAAVAGFVWLAVPGWGTYYEDQKADWRGATAFVLQDARSNDAIIFFSPTGRRPFEYYLSLSERGSGGLPEPIYPPTAFGAYDNETFLDYMPRVTGPKDFADVGADHPRVWVLLSKGGAAKSRRVMQAVASRCPEVFERNFRGIRVRLLQSCGQPTDQRSA